MLARIPTLGATLAGLDGASPMALANDDGRDGNVVALNPWQLAADLEAIPGLAGHVYVARLPIEDDEPGQGGSMHWVEDSTRYTGMLSIIAGRAGVAGVKLHLEQTGHTIVGKEGAMNIRGMGDPRHHTIRVDMFALAPDGKTVLYIEVKNGLHARLTWNQKAGVRAIKQGQAIPVGPGSANLVEAIGKSHPAYLEGSPLPPMEIVVVYP